MNDQPSDALLGLNEDVLRSIMEMLRPGQCLRPLSLTCKWIRALCCPILFRECIVSNKRVDSWRGSVFIPSSLWPYICTLYLTGSFEREEIMWLRKANLHSVDPDRTEEILPPYLDAAVNRVGDTLRVAFSSMPALYAIDILTSDGWDAECAPGISPYIFGAILSTPHLRHLTITGPLCDIDDAISEPFSLSLQPRLSSLVYILGNERSASQVSRAEKEEMSLLLAHSHECIEVLYSERKRTDGADGYVALAPAATDLPPWRKGDILSTSDPHA
ncbi:hypothetical protein FKP32DRAFT_1699896 [Trametes sanguinea]|nr:hypothetical protein FKP32DRAFT_1699896 [Trametes sanguinea]